MEVITQWRKHGNDFDYLPGDYVFAATSSGALWQEITDPVQVEDWARGFRAWIAETIDMIGRKEQGTGYVREIDWRASVTKMQRHLKKLESECRTAKRTRLFRRPLNSKE